MAKDYYQILDVPRNASDEEIKKAYRKLALQYHPDRNPGKEAWANDKFKEINEAFSVLGDPEKRRQYDQFGTTGNISDIFSSPYTRTAFEDLMRDFSAHDFGLDFLDNIFGDFLKGRGVSFKVYRQGSGSPGRIDWEEMFGQPQRAASQEVNYEITITKEQAVKGVEKDLARRGRKLRVKVPAGVKNGTRVRLRNARQLTDGQPGDIVIQVRIKGK